MSEPLAIDADVTAIVDRWAVAVGTPDHARAAGKLDELLVELTAARKFRDRLLHEACEEIERGWMERRDPDVVNQVAARYPELSEELYGFFTLMFEAAEGSLARDPHTGGTDG